MGDIAQSSYPNRFADAVATTVAISLDLPRLRERVAIQAETLVARGLFRPARRIVIAGSGDSLFAATAVVPALRRWTGFAVEAEQGLRTLQGLRQRPGQARELPPVPRPLSPARVAPASTPGSSCGRVMRTKAGRARHPTRRAGARGGADNVTVSLFTASPRARPLAVELYQLIQFDSSPMVAAISALEILLALLVVFVLARTIGLERFRD
jgi:hypothetical protein